MCVFAYAARIFLPVVICASIAFANTDPERLSSPTESRQNTALASPFAPKNDVAYPQVDTLMSDLANDILLKSPERQGSNAPDSYAKSENKSTDTISTQYSSLSSDETGSVGDAFAPPEPFNQLATIAPPGETPAKWAELQSRIIDDENTIASCVSGDKPCSPAAKRFLSIFELGRSHQGRARLGWINRAVNLNVRPMSDWAQYGYADYWASPLQTLTSGAGDCEDYAILKYVVLRHLGIAASDLRLVIVRDDMRQAEHAILAVRDEQNWLILDNRTMVMLNADQARYYYPLFVMDYRGVRIFSITAARR